MCLVHQLDLSLQSGLIVRLFSCIQSPLLIFKAMYHCILSQGQETLESRSCACDGEEDSGDPSPEDVPVGIVVCNQMAVAKR